MLTRAIVAVVIACGHAREASTQTFRVGFAPPDVRLEILERPYTVHGGTAEELLREMVSLGPAGLATFSYWFEWRYQSEELPTALGRNASGVCRVSDFEIDFDVTAAYPVWERPADAAPELVAAWEELQAQILRRWEARHDGIVDLGREISRQVRRLEEPCPTMTARAIELVEELRDESSPEARAASLASEAVVVQWPPPGHAEALRDARREPAPTAPAPPPAPSPVVTPSGDEVPIPAGLYDALYTDLRRTGRLRVVAGFRHLGELRFLRAFGSDSVLAARTPVELPPFTDVLVGTLAAVLEREGLVSLREPLSTYLGNLTPRLGSVTLEQLLAHRSGLDNARAPASADWSEWIAELDDRALFTEPGAVYSYSMYGYPLVVRTLETLTGSSLADLVRERLIEPAEMEVTVLAPAPRGLPVATTSGLDLMRFAATWLDGGFAETPVVPDAAASAQADGERVYAGGVWRDRVGGQARAYLRCAQPGGSVVGLELFPATRTAVVVLAQEWPTNTARFVLNEVASELGIGAEIFQPIALIGDGRLDLPPSSCTPPTWNDQRVQDAGLPAESGAWPGSYTNGDRRFVLRDVEGALAAVPFEQQLVVTHHSGDLHFVTMEGRPFFPLRLVRDEAGRRYVLLDDRAYLHDEDRPSGVARGSRE